MPDIPLPLSVKTYSLKIVNKLTDFNLTKDEIEFFKIQGIREVPNNGDIELFFNLKGINVNTAINSKQVKVSVDGKEVVKTVYFYNVSSRLDCDYKVTGGPDYSEVINTFYINRTSNSESKTFDTKEEAEKELAKNMNELVYSSKHACIHEALLGTDRSNNDNYGYFPDTDVIKISTAKGRKIDYSDLDTALVNFKNAILLFNDQKFSDYFLKANQCINVWTNALKEYDPTNKKARINSKIASKLYLNIAFANLYMKKFTDSYEAVKKHDEIEEEVSKELLANIIDKDNRNYMNELRLADKITFKSKTKAGPIALKLSVINGKLFLADSAQSIEKINPNLMKLLDIALFYPMVVKWRNGTENDLLFTDYEYIKDNEGMITGMKINTGNKAISYKTVTLNMSNYPIITSMAIRNFYMNDSHKPVYYDVMLGFHWEKGKIIDFSSNVNKEDFDVQYDNEGRISMIIDREFTKDPDGGFNNRAYQFEYSGNQRSKELSGRISKSAFKIECENTYTYENNAIIQESTKYKAGKPLSDSKSKFIARKLDDRHYTFEEHRPSENTVTENIFNDKGFVLTNIYSWGNKKRITTNVYNSEDAALEITSEEFVNNVIEEKRIKRNYSKSEGIDTRKPYEWQEGLYKFDKNGEWFWEERNGKFKKKVNGIWTDWIQFTY